MSSEFELSDDQHAQFDAWIYQGKMLTAWAAAKQLPPLHTWAAGRSLRMASRIVSGVGNDRLSSAWDCLNWRRQRNDPERYFQALFTRVRWKSHVELLPEVARLLDASPDMETSTRANLLAFQGWMLGCLRDFAPAFEAIDAALKLVPDDAWIHIQHSHLLEQADRYADALHAAETARALRPYYRPAVMQTVDCLSHLGRDDEAMRLLHEAHEQTENSAFAMRLQAFYSEREDHANALWCLDQIERLQPEMPPFTRKWLAGRRADFLYLAGDIDGCLEWCDRKGEGFQAEIARNIRREGGRDGQRKRLHVPFTRQHNMTCAPATLASIAKFWGRDFNHLEIAEAICYAGTPWHKERDWATAHGFIAREFSLNREVLKTLIDRGIPFTLTTAALTSSHLQACIGYDERQDTVLLRDPTHRHYVEMLMTPLLEQHPVHGPRCMLMVPAEEGHRLEGLDLPNEALCDQSHHIAKALDRHDHGAAQAALDRMQQLDADHPLTLDAIGRVASYSNHFARELDALEQLSSRFPKHEWLTYAKVSVLRRMDDYEAAKQLLESAVATKDSDPVFVSIFGEMLLEDARNLPLAGHFLRRATRLRRGESSALESKARWHDKSGDRHAAARLRRHAATLNQNSEYYASAYFESCLGIGRAEEGLRHLRERVETLGAAHSAPWLTLAQAYERLQSPKAKEVIEEAVRRLPDDGELKLRGGRMMISWGAEERARGLALMDEARGKVAESYWLNLRAQAANFLGDRARVIECRKAQLAINPLAEGAYESLAHALAEEEGDAAALEFVRTAAAAHPRQPRMWGLLASWQRPEHPADAIASLDRLLALDVDHLWAWRERAILRHQQGDHAGAIHDIQEALIRDPRSAETHGVHANLLRLQGAHDETRDALRRALQHQIDYTWAIQRLVDWSQSKEAALAAIAFIEGEMERQVSNGDCVTAFQQHAWSHLEPMQLMEKLRQFCASRPDLWQTWSARIEQALRMDRHEEATQCIEHLQSHFPLLPRTWIEVASVKRAAALHQDEAAALRKATDMAPAWDWAAQQLAEVLERLGDFDGACEALGKITRYNPLNAINHGYWADLLLRLKRTDEAEQRLKDAVRVDPYYTWGWRMLANLYCDRDQNDQFLALFRDSGSSRRRNVKWWENAVEIFARFELWDEALQACDDGLAIVPKHIGLRDWRARLLCRSGRHDEALKACEATDEKSPRELQGRRAWVLMQSGDAPAAIRELRQLLEREPDYIWGWYTLAEWLEARKEWADLQKATENLIRLCPRESIVYGYAGTALLNLDRKDEAKQALQKGYLLDPSYQFAGRKLVFLHLEDRQYDEAEKILASLRHYTPGSWVEYDAVRMDILRGKHAAAMETAIAAFLNIQDGEALASISRQFVNNNHARAWRKKLRKTLAKHRDVSPAFMVGWAHAWINSASLFWASLQLSRFNITDDARNAAWDAIIRADDHYSTFQLKLWMLCHKQRFRDDDRIWDAIGYALITKGKAKSGATWLADWESRKIPHSYTLSNLALALDATKGHQAALKVRQEGMKRFPVDDDFKVGLASTYASSGDVAQAAALLAAVESQRLSQHYRCMGYLAQAVIAAAKHDENESWRCYNEVVVMSRQQMPDRGLNTHVKAAQRALAGHLPWAKGKVSKVVKKWRAVRMQSNQSLLASIMQGVWLEGAEAKCLRVLNWR